jgi:dihydrofolate reductase
MRILKLQSQISVDGFIARPKGELDWMTWNWDDELKKYVADLHDSVDTILLGKKMTEGFISYWTDIVTNKPGSTEYPFAKKILDIPKVVFAKTPANYGWTNTRLAKGDIVEEVIQLKKQSGKGLVVYGVSGLASSLIRNNLIDEYHLFINPSVLGKGLSIFNSVEEVRKLKLVQSKAFTCGIVVNQYLPG